MRPYLRAANVGWAGLRLDDVKTMNFTDAEMAVYRLSKGDLLLNEASGSAREVGKPALWRDEINDCAFQNTLIRVRPRGIDPEFLLHYFRHVAGVGKFAEAARGVGINHLGREALASWLTPVPPPSEQRRIVRLLDQAHELCTKRRKSIAELEDLKTSLFEDAFGNLAGNDRDEGSTLLGDVSTVQGGLQISGSRKSLPAEVPYLRVANVHRGSLDLSEVKTLNASESEIARTRLKAGDILVVEGHGNPKEIGRVAAWDGRIDPCVHQNHLIRVRLSADRIMPTFAVAYLNSRAGRRHLLGAARTTSGLNTISVRDVRNTPISLPPLEMQQRFHKQCEGIDLTSAAQGRQLAALDALLNAIRGRAFRGEL